ncbi:MAG: sulfurtransferase TusA family protein [Planctomycetes bacterium]|nr:sulfurtransferase TusA family protein [Planctomycetota bacterium]
MSCGDLVLELRKRMTALAPRQVLELRATDPGAPRDIPAWCGLTRHPLIAAREPRYWIRRRED